MKSTISHSKEEINKLGLLSEQMTSKISELCIAAEGLESCRKQMKSITSDLKEAVKDLTPLYKDIKSSPSEFKDAAGILLPVSKETKKIIQAVTKRPEFIEEVLISFLLRSPLITSFISSQS